MKTASILFVSCLLLRVAATAGEPTLALPEWQAPDDAETVGTLAASRQNRVFLDEFLPPLFTRTLVLDGTVAENRELLWVFTGPRAGLTVAIRPGEVELIAEHYDSYALHPEEVLAGDADPGRYGSLKRSLLKTPIPGDPTAITLVLDHKASAELFINGVSIYRDIFKEDLSRHQIQGGNAPDWHVLRPAAAPASVTVDPAEHHQQMVGWGGIASPNSYQLLSDAGKEQWWNLLAEYGLNVQREYPAGRTLKRDYSNLGSPDAAIHHHYGDNFPNGETSDFDYLSEHSKLKDSTVWFEYWWDLPHWTRGDAEAYAESILVYSQRLKEARGRPPEVIGVQNEHLADNWSEQIQAIRRQLDDAGFTDTRIHMNNAGKMHNGMDWLRQYRDNPVAWEILDYTASNQYDYQDYFTDPDGYDATLLEWRELSAEKPYLSVELCVNDSAWQLPSYRIAFQMAQQYHKTLALADATALAYCWLLLDTEQPSFLWSRTLWGVDKENGFVPAATNHQVRCFGAYSRRIPAGMTRVAADAADPDLLVTAFTGENDTATVVLINRSTTPRDITLEGLAASLTTAERTSHQQPNLVDPAFDPAAPVRIDPGEIVTLTNVPLGTLP